jgi:hypothetical protein
LLTDRAAWSPLQDGFVNDSSHIHSVRLLGRALDAMSQDDKATTTVLCVQAAQIFKAAFDSLARQSTSAPVTAYVCEIVDLFERYPMCRPDADTVAEQVVSWLLRLDWDDNAGAVLDGPFAQTVSRLGAYLQRCWTESPDVDRAYTSTLHVVFAQLSAGHGRVSPATSAIIAAIPLSYSSTAADYLALSTTVTVSRPCDTGCSCHRTHKSRRRLSAC